MNYLKYSNLCAGMPCASINTSYDGTQCIEMLTSSELPHSNMKMRDLRVAKLPLAVQTWCEQQWRSLERQQRSRGRQYTSELPNGRMESQSITVRQSVGRTWLFKISTYEHDLPFCFQAIETEIFCKISHSLRCISECEFEVDVLSRLIACKRFWGDTYSLSVHLAVITDFTDAEKEEEGKKEWHQPKSQIATLAQDHYTCCSIQDNVARQLVLICQATSLVLQRLPTGGIPQDRKEGLLAVLGSDAGLLNFALHCPCWCKERETQFVKCIERNSGAKTQPFSCQR